ncbi:LysM peptidoglycan-binding domain-containing protein [Ornithinimicrobium pratense]|uniref:LysM peptidoglycan-binding domain-containing protein n=1 Tax=Ornithinimicrobium pratense TaxID=2593973 RepID=A0A5J6V5S7_9MICO|nr:LysM domain-containing protein [Ornithinimicrobium pratense]QFG69125.1 LysM peptidoglycan-binding domain-containing protein [Ornithinimicrobium pratense]
MGLFAKVRQVLAKAEKVLPGSGRAADGQTLDDRAFNERVFEDRDDVLGTAQPEPGAAASTPAASPDHGDAPDPVTAAADTEAEQQTPRRYRTHTIQPGQSLADVAEQHGVSVQEVAELNGVDPELVFAGQVLRIPHG